jgi:hypothetical protein
MGLFLIYEKFTETETEVEYHYGHGLDKLDKRLVIDKSAPEGPLKEGSPDGMAQRVIGLVLSRREGDAWPDGGALQS